MESLQQKINRVLQEHIEVLPYNPEWQTMFENEKRHLLSCPPCELIKRIEHFGSTAIPGMPSKPVIDMLVEVTSLDETKEKIAPVLESQGYDYFWRPSWGDDTPPFYAWFIKRNRTGIRTHHIHMVEKHFDHWERLLFRDYLIENPDIRDEYAKLKIRLSKLYRNDRIAYTEGKTGFITKITAIARQHYGKS